MKLYIKGSRKFSQPIEEVTREQSSGHTWYNVSYADCNHAGTSYCPYEQTYIDKNVPQKVLNFIENESIHTNQVAAKSSTGQPLIIDTFVASH